MAERGCGGELGFVVVGGGGEVVADLVQDMGGGLGVVGAVGVDAGADVGLASWGHRAHASTRRTTTLNRRPVIAGSLRCRPLGSVSCPSPVKGSLAVQPDQGADARASAGGVDLFIGGEGGKAARRRSTSSLRGGPALPKCDSATSACPPGSAKRGTAGHVAAVVATTASEHSRTCRSSRRASRAQGAPNAKTCSMPVSRMGCHTNWSMTSGGGWMWPVRPVEFRK